MKKTVFLGFLAMVLLSSKISFASSSSPSYPLDGSYPIVLIHGILGFDDRNGLLGGMAKYWGGLDNELRKSWPNNSTTAVCSKVLTPGTTAMSHTTQRADETAYLVNQWMAACGYTKVHLLGHSQGGLVARWMAANVSSIKAKIRTVTTLNSVHRGAPVADIVLNLIPSWLTPYVSTVMAKIGGLLYKDQNGDGKVDQMDVIAMGQSLTYSYMNNTFNPQTPNNPAIKYYSYGSKMECFVLGSWCDDVFQHPIMGLTYPATFLGGGAYGLGNANDGIVPLNSQKWGTWNGEPSYSTITTTGVDHLQSTKMQLLGVVNGKFDEKAWLLKMATNAKANQ